MIGTYLNTLAILVGTGIGCLLHGGIKPRYQEALYLAIGLAALGIGLENVVNNILRATLYRQHCHWGGPGHLGEPRWTL